MPDFPITPQIPVERIDLEYPTEDVPFIYWGIIGKLDFLYTIWTIIVSKDSFTDKGLGGFVADKQAQLILRYIDGNNNYLTYFKSDEATQDLILKKYVDGTPTIIGTEAIDIYTGAVYSLIFSASGSTLKVFRRSSTPAISVTDTDLASGKIGIVIDAVEHAGYVNYPYVFSPLSELPKPQSIVEYNVVEYEDYHMGKKVIGKKPDMPQDLIEVSQDQVTPEEWMAIQPNPKGEHGLPLVDRLSVNWGAIDYKGEPTMLCAIYEQSPEYLRKDRVLTHIEYAKKKNLMVIKTPRTLREVDDIHRKIASTRKEMMITVNELAYHLLGKPELEIDAVADFYERELLDLNRIKRVPTWELHRTLRRWEELGKRYRRENAIKKLAKVRRR